MFFTAAGSTFDIGDLRANWAARQVSAADFSSEVWVPVEGVSSLGRISGEWQTEETASPDADDPDNPQMPTVLKSARPAKTMQVVAAMVAGDVGQMAMLAAEGIVHPVTFRLTAADGSVLRFVALVLGADHVFDEAANVMSWSFSLKLQSNILREAS
ncbi:MULTISPECIES: hypothetical protein [Rhizobium/Agrobacterium group]|uniref:Phage tail protein n=2 Tax=Rhizobium/Agrobacterium group TaxID=227290 RepID=B9JSB8_ALLAM|nr:MULTISPECIES: hypothetical protein [Rhizobium/Agrobacterium group]ACM35611.1 hypothetical protein Avi_0866 [Allorhizobium ampelinum S4]MUO29450.1 hypothetical protein [Agrobacterium vitis]MUO42625.1 hypothetical protein [Agrobacterium vitis]MUP10594.1 hypothetical protein [Agrobacterium vitis]